MCCPVDVDGADSLFTFLLGLFGLGWNWGGTHDCDGGVVFLGCALRCDDVDEALLLGWGVSFGYMVDILTKAVNVYSQVELVGERKKGKWTYHRLEIRLEVVCLLHPHSILIQRPPLPQ